MSEPEKKWCTKMLYDSIIRNHREKLLSVEAGKSLNIGFSET